MGVRRFDNGKVTSLNIKYRESRNRESGEYEPLVVRVNFRGPDQGLLPAIADKGGDKSDPSRFDTLVGCSVALGANADVRDGKATFYPNTRVKVNRWGKALRDYHQERKAGNPGPGQKPDDADDEIPF